MHYNSECSFTEFVAITFKKPSYHMELPSTDEEC